MSSMQFHPSEFDQWAASYDAEARTNAGFPFDGYDRVLETIARAVSGDGGAEQSAQGDILDLGAGTGSLSALLAGRGARLWCLDFSEKMLEIARVRLPAARFARADLRGEWPADFRRRYHHIVSGYTFHHFPLEEKVALADRLLRDRLLPGGRLVIGDISFADAEAMQALRRRLGEAWEEEYYWLAGEALPALAAQGWQARYEQVSSCAGVYVIHG